MHASRCFRASQGRLGCISCHDPHVLPNPEEKAAYFRTRCLECHAERGCSLPPEVRIQKKGVDDCIGCHMPRLSSSNNTHVATTNHRVPRLANGEQGSPDNAEPFRRDRTSLVNFHRNLLSERELALAERDRGIALCRGGGAAAAAEALPILQAAVTARPDDLIALESLGEVLGRLGRPVAGLDAYKRALAQGSTRQTALEGAAFLSFKAGRHADAIEFWRQAIAVNPWRSDFHAQLAASALELGDWRVGAGACREALRLNPMLLPVRAWLVQCDLELGDREGARAQLETLLRFDPPDRDNLLRRFSSIATPR
jgi:tetratricopeptide (TPR) repeat protein